jgi:IS5 family transposase
MVERVRQVAKQTKLRIFAGVTQSQEKILSMFEPHTEIIRKGKASKPTEFGKLVKIQEAENQIVTHFQVFAERATSRLDLFAVLDPGTPTEIGASPKRGGGRCGILLPKTGASCAISPYRVREAPNIRSAVSPN